MCSRRASIDAWELIVEDEPLRVESMNPVIGGEVQGIDLSAPRDATDIKALRDEEELDLVSDSVTRAREEGS
jgi:hypothetical protein